MIGKIVYGVAVVVISLAILVALILFFESRDDSTLEGSQIAPPSLPTV